jgi:hypothetical protein
LFARQFRQAGLFAAKKNSAALEELADFLTNLSRLFIAFSYMSGRQCKLLTKNSRSLTFFKNFGAKNPALNTSAPKA